MKRLLSREHRTSTWSSPPLKTSVRLCQQEGQGSGRGRGRERAGGGVRVQVCRSYLEEGSWLRNRSVLPDVNQDPPEWLHACSWTRLLRWISWTGSQPVQALPPGPTCCSLRTKPARVLLLVSCCQSYVLLTAGMKLRPAELRPTCCVNECGVLRVFLYLLL